MHTCQVTVDLKLNLECGAEVVDAVALDGRDASRIVLVCERHARMWQNQDPLLLAFDSEVKV